VYPHLHNGFTLLPYLIRTYLHYNTTPNTHPSFSVPPQTPYLTVFPRYPYAALQSTLLPALRPVGSLLYLCTYTAYTARMGYRQYGVETKRIFLNSFSIWEMSTEAAAGHKHSWKSLLEQRLKERPSYAES